MSRRHDNQVKGPGGPASHSASGSADEPTLDDDAPLTESGVAEDVGAGPQERNGDGDAVEEDLDALLEDIKRERDEYLDLARRAKADFENFRKRAARDGAEAEKRGKAGLARELLPSIDNLERALRASGVKPFSDSAPSSADAGQASPDVSEEVSAQEALARGVALVHSELEAGLARAGVESYDPAGEPFDPAVCEAISTAEADGTVASGIVLETLERGYRLDGQVIRPARVIVSE